MSEASATASRCTLSTSVMFANQTDTFTAVRDPRCRVAMLLAFRCTQRFAGALLAPGTGIMDVVWMLRFVRDAAFAK